VVVFNLAFWAPDVDGLLFSLVSLFITWQKTVGGCLKGDLGFSNALPVPELLDNQREGIVKAGKKVIGAGAISHYLF